MCLAIPMELIAVNHPRGLVRSAGVELEISLDLVDKPRVGEYVIVHAGYAIQTLPADEAKESLAIFAKLFAPDDASKRDDR